MTKKLFLALLAPALMGGLMACNKQANSDLDPEAQSTGDTYMSVTFATANPNSTRAAEDGSFNSIGEYIGRDKIENVTVYIVSTDEGTVEHKDFDFGQDGVEAVTGQNATYRTKAWKVTPGFKDVYVLVNLKNTPIANALNAATTKDAFETAYANAYELTNGVGVQPIYAKYEATEKKDIIGMNGKSDISLKVEPGVTMETAKEGTKNCAKVSVRRIVAQAAVTKKEGIDLAIKAKRNGAETTIATLENLKWDVMQFEQKTYLLPMAVSADKNAMKPKECKTPSYDFTNGNLTAWADATTGAGSKYFYRAFDGEEVKDFTCLDGNNPENVKNIVATPMKFVTETTHAFGDKLQKDGGTAPYTSYRKGNTPYVLVCATIKVDDNAWATGEKDGYTAGSDLYLGLKDGKFYSDLTKAKAANTNVAAGAGATVGITNNKDNVLTYTGGKCYYFAWLNPDVTDKPINSPVIRNNIYHVNITAFSKLGFTGNPLNPGQDGPKPDPDEDTPTPDETLYPVDTHMSTVISIVNWGVHSYDHKF